MVKDPAGRDRDGRWTYLLPVSIPGHPIDGNRWSENQSIDWYESIKLIINWYQLVLVNRWSINNNTKTVHWLLSINTATSNKRLASYLSDHPPFLGRPGDETGIKFWPSHLNAKNIPIVQVLESPTCPSLPFHVIMSTQEVWEEALLNTRCIVRGYHLCCFEVNTGEVFTGNKKRGEHGNAFKVVNHHGQLGHLQSELVDPLWPVLANISVSICNQ